MPDRAVDGDDWELAEDTAVLDAGSAISGRLRRVSPSPARPARAADRIVEALSRAGIDTVYGVPGGAISPIYDALIDFPHIRVVHVRHETSAFFMAIGHTHLRPGSIPCVLVTSGPGITNAVTGLAAALGEGTPVLVIGGEVPRTKFGRGALQEGSSEAIDVLSIVRTVTRAAESVTIPGRAAFQVDAALATARRQRGPVFLSLPLDVAVAPAPPLTMPQVSNARLSLLPSAILTEAATALREARRPLVLVGSGARGAFAQVRHFTERLNLPVITSPKGKGIVSEADHRCLGVFGYGGHPTSTAWLEEQAPDVVLALGCGFSEPSTNSWSPLLQASRTMIQVDVDPSQFGRNYRVDIAHQGDCRPFVEALDALLDDLAPFPLAVPGPRHLRPNDMHVDRSPLSPARVLSVLQEQMPASSVYTVDIGEHLLFAVHYLRASYPDQFIVSTSLGSMGSGIGAAIGAKLAAPERAVVAVCGDYGFQMYGMDINTCVHEGIGVVFVVMNDSRMRMVEAGVARNYGRSLPMDGPSVDFAAVAKAHGAQGHVVRTTDDLRAALRARTNSRPLVLDVRIDPGAQFPINPREREISNFTAS